MTRSFRAAVFLTTRWRHFLMLNFAVDPAVVTARVPEGCELDLWNGRCFVSVVGFSFSRTRVRGLAIPGHRVLPEVSLRFYVRRSVGREVRRRVVFVKELVPRQLIALVARAVCSENYVALSMRRRLDAVSGTSEYQTRYWLAYEWRRAGLWERAAAAFSVGSPLSQTRACWRRS